jgi:hypothetical protein
LRVADWPGFRVAGNATPEVVKPAPVSAAELIVTGAVPVDVKVTGWVEAVFTVTLPNVRLAALIVNCGLAAVVPVPLRFTTAVPLGTELLRMVNWPDDAPVAAGSNCTFSVTDWPGFTIAGNVAPDTVKPIPVSVAELIVTGAPPVEVNVKGCIDGEPTVKLPNVKLAALTLSIGVEPGLPLLALTPKPLTEPWPIGVPVAFITVNWPEKVEALPGRNEISKL